MSRELRFGVVTLPNEKWPTLVERWQRLEEMGFDSIWDIDHFVNPYTNTQPWYDAWTLLAGLALRTQRVQIGVLVSPASFRNPSLLIKEALTVDHISQGRLDLAIGAGGHQTDYDMTGAPPISGKNERAAKFGEFTAIVQQLLVNGEISDETNKAGVDFSGKHYTIKNAINRLTPYKQRHLPITIAAHIPRSLEIAARYADTWISYGKRNGSPEETFNKTQSRMKTFTGCCKAIGRDADSIRKALLVGFASEDPFASGDAFEAFVDRYWEIGITDFIFYYPADEFYHTPKATQYRMFEKIVLEIFPRLRAHYKRPSEESGQVEAEAVYQTESTELSSTYCAV